MQIPLHPGNPNDASVSHVDGNERLIMDLEDEPESSEATVEELTKARIKTVARLFRLESHVTIPATWPSFLYLETGMILRFLLTKNVRRKLITMEKISRSYKMFTESA